jgi:putative Holliday junction resolvase
MALDVGERRVGLAIADELGLIASPLRTVRRGGHDLEEIASAAAAHGVGTIVVGLPTGLSGREGPQAAAVREFAAMLETVVGPQIALAFADERLTTAVAERTLRAGGGKRERNKERVDAVAAAVILQGYLDARRARAARQGSAWDREAG